MPMIRPSSDLRNKYAEISNYCHQNDEAVFLTRNGSGDLAVMSIENYQRLVAAHELRSALMQGLREAENGQTLSAEQAFENIRKTLTM